MQTNKLILYIMSLLLVLGSLFMILDKETNNLWGLLPLSLGIIITLLNKFKKVN